LKDWPKLVEAVDEKIEEQKRFVATWDARVGVRQHENQYTLVHALAGGPLSVSLDVPTRGHQGKSARDKVAEIAAFVANWDSHVRPAGHQPNVTGAGHLSVAAAEAQWDITKQTVSRWRTWLKDADAFLERIIVGVHRKALLEPEPNRQAPNSGEEEWYTPAQYIAAARQLKDWPKLAAAAQEKVAEIAAFVAGVRCNL
jgi:hypothetical protein